jgi:hypothetical protein
MDRTGSDEIFPIASSGQPSGRRQQPGSSIRLHSAGFDSQHEDQPNLDHNPQRIRNVARHLSTQISHAPQLELPLFLLEYHCFFSTSCLALRPETSQRIESHHHTSPPFAPLRIASHCIWPHFASHLATPRIVSGHTSHRIASTRTIYLFHALSFDTKQPISPQQNKNKAWIVKSTSMSRTYTMGLLVPGPLFGGQHWRRD